MTLQYSVVEKDNVEVTNFFGDLNETERKSIKDLSCKLVKQINERGKADRMLALIKHENQILQ